MFDHLSNNDKILLAIIGFILFAGLIENATVFILLMVLAFAAYVSNERNKRDIQQQRRPREIDHEPAVVRRERPANTERVQQHALAAVRAAGHDPDNLTVLPVDIGIISYHGDDPPVIHRTWPVRDDCDYVQPYVQLRVPNIATGCVRFEIDDSSGQTVFIHEENHQLERGRNLITPGSRLPVHDEIEVDQRWRVRVKADGVLLAQYTFGWEVGENTDFNRHLGEDGEINSELRAVLAESKLQDISLDELLAEQQENAESQQR